MIMSMWMVSGFYLLSIISFYSNNTLFFSWILMELNLLMFLVLIFFLQSKVQDFFSYGLFYFLIQSLGSIMFLFSLIMEKLSYSFFMNFMLVLSISLKMGIFPWSFWVFQMGSYINFKSLYFLLVVQKIPLFLILFSSSYWNVELLSVFSFIFGSFMIFFSKSLEGVIISSSIASIFWVFLIFCQSINSFFFFYMVYGMILFLVLYSYSTTNLVNSVSSSLSSVIPITSFMFLAGLPPMSLFFFKFDLIFFMFDFMSLTEMILFWFFSFVGLFGYLKLFFFKFFLGRFLYLKNEFSPKMMLINLGTFLFFFLFII